MGQVGMVPLRPYVPMKASEWVGHVNETSLRHPEQKRPSPARQCTLRSRAYHIQTYRTRFRELDQKAVQVCPSLSGILCFSLLDDDVPGAPGL